MAEPLKIKDYYGVAIHVGADGKFGAVVDGESVSRTTLSALEKFIANVQVPVRAIVNNSYSSFQFYIKNVSHFQQGRGVEAGGQVLSIGSELYVYDAATTERLAILKQEYQELVVQWRREIGSLTSLNERNFEQIRAAQSQVKEAPNEPKD